MQSPFIEKFIAEKRKEFHDWFTEAYYHADYQGVIDLSEGCQTFLRSSLQALAEEIAREVERLRSPRPMNSHEDWILAWRTLEGLSEPEKQYVRDRDNGLYVKTVAWAEREDTIRDILTLLHPTPPKGEANETKE